MSGPAPALPDEGPWLFGGRSIADAFYAPVATRFRSYGVDLSADTASYCKAVFDDPDFRLWEAACVPDSWDQPGHPTIDGLHRDPGATQADPGR
jgi:glutathione S-transferase